MRQYKVIVSLQSCKIQTSTTLNDPNSYFGRQVKVGGQHDKIPIPRSTFVARVVFCCKSGATQNLQGAERDWERATGMPSCEVRMYENS